VWGGQNFTHSAGLVSLEELEETEHGAIMCAEMNKDGGSSNRQELNLSEKIVNFDGQLRVVWLDQVDTMSESILEEWIGHCECEWT
jgi:hypothetical protein